LVAEHIHLLQLFPQLRHTVPRPFGLFQGIRLTDGVNPGGSHTLIASLSQENFLSFEQTDFRIEFQDAGLIVGLGRDIEVNSSCWRKNEFVVFFWNAGKMRADWKYFIKGNEQMAFAL
jgi:hypothetical protein